MNRKGLLFIAIAVPLLASGAVGLFMRRTPAVVADRIAPSAFTGEQTP